MDIFLLVLFWGLTILAALAGWGLLLGRKTPGAGHDAANWLEAPAWGIAVSSFVGSLLNLLGLATWLGVLVFILAGCVLAGLSLIAPLKNLLKPAHRSRRDWKWLALLVLPLGALALRFGGSVMIKTFYPNLAQAEYVYLNPGDDLKSYLVSPERMLQTGSIGQDPFNCRQMMSGLGAQHFLNAMALAVLAPDNVHIIEGGVGLAAACLAAAGLGLRMQLGRIGATSLMLVPLIFRPWYINISSTTTTAAVLIALCSALVQLFGPAANRPRWLLASGLLLGAACSLKSTTIPTAVILVAVAAGLSALTQKNWRPLGLGLQVGLVALVAMTPWMWWQYHSSGTPLYPVLGRGFHVEVFFPSVPMPFHGKVVHELKIGLILPIAILAGLLFAWAVPVLRATIYRPAACVSVAIVVGWTIAWPLIAISTEYDGVSRYLLAACITSLTMVLACAWRTGLQLGEQPSRHWARWIGPLLLTAVVFSHWTELKIAYGQITPDDLANSLSGRPYDWNSEANLVHAAQAAVPAGAKILAYTDTPFLFDFISNPIFVVDCPGEASLPPGLPVRQGGEAVASYLMGHNIRYVIYSYKTQAGNSRAAFGFLLEPAYGTLVNRIAALSFAFQEDLADLSHTRARLYDDGSIFVLDLASRLPPKPAHP
jgi:hypothetical protein